jgi:uncharacterized cupredoxin-like copper-binding protein
MIRRVAPLCFVALASLAACSSSNDKNAVALTATDSKCTPAQHEFKAGKITFNVTNKGEQVTEVYVYGEGDKVVGEVENIGPGATRRLSVDVKEGRYELACKPGMTGSGIRAHIEVSGDGGSQSSSAKKAGRAVDVQAADYSFSLTDPRVKAGEAVEFKLANRGTQRHEFEVFGPDGEAIGEIEAVSPGSNGKATFEFTAAGTYRYECHVADHYERGMKGELVAG